MIKLVQKARGTRYAAKRIIIDLVFQRQMGVWYILLLRLVSTRDNLLCKYLSDLFRSTSTLILWLVSKVISGDTHPPTYACLAHWRFLYFHGQRHARLVRDETVYDEPVHERTMLITLASPLLFFVPGGYLRDLEGLWTDEVLIETVWETFVTKLLGEWQDVVLWVGQTRFFRFSFDSRDSSVGRDACRQRGLPRHSRRRNYKPQRGRYNEPSPTHYFNISCPDRQFFVDTSQHRKRCD
jgi:hypothetical protein